MSVRNDIEYERFDNFEAASINISSGKNLSDDVKKNNYLSKTIK